MSRPLLAVDGDSFAHRAYHALPKTAFRRSDGGPGNALEGFTNMLLRLWQGERPRAVVVAWDTLEVPTYRHTAFDGYQAGREFEAELLEQLDMLPGFISEARIVCVKAAGYEADDFLAAAAAKEEAAGGHALVATSDRDAFQLASERTTVLQPVRGSAPARIGPAEVRERYGVEPEQVPDFIALRGDPSDRIPGARGVGEKGAANLLAQYSSLEQMLAEGRFVAEADALRLYRRLAALDRSAPIPPLPDIDPDWAALAKRASSLGLGGLAGRLEEAASSR
ncbi:MAG: 5'-3' exonuclease [Actinobacteria bacterium]|nr:MAG: 5'-3' exonuclease [Actinomycetota bacterium]TML74530.1 MAG: 5'-3' exonuclease [Actinomycetota bacterium]